MYKIIAYIKYIGTMNIILITRLCKYCRNNCCYSSISFSLLKMLNVNTKSCVENVKMYTIAIGTV